MFEPGALVLVPFPFSDLSSSKRRPVLALTGPDPQGDFVGCPITSRAGRPHAHPILAEDLVEGALPLASWVRPNRPVTLHVDLVVRQFGRVSSEFRRTIANSVCRYIEAA